MSDDTKSGAARTSLRPHLLLAAGGGVLGVLIVVLAVALRREPVKGGHPVQEVARPSVDGTFSVTLDARDGSKWIGFDLLAGRVVEPPAGDLLVQRHYLRAPHGATDLGVADLAVAALPVDAAWEADRDLGSIVQSPAFARWYRYSYWTHLLEPLGHVQAVRTSTGVVALVRIDSYYCSPGGAGCLTFTYRLP